MIELLRRCFKWKRDNNYYFGLLLLQVGIGSIAWYLIFDAFEPAAFLVTFAICGWGFVLLWKSDNDYRFQLVQQNMVKLAEELQESKYALSNQAQETSCSHERESLPKKRLSLRRNFGRGLELKMVPKYQSKKQAKGLTLQQPEFPAAGLQPTAAVGVMR
ncbi:MAG TPA: hypothetical protein VEC37_13875, partial [Bacillota bacterium]|nr:hypothetical protein [Bacillota bacterium]